MDAERHDPQSPQPQPEQPLPASTYTLRVTQRELDLIIAALDMAGNPDEITPRRLSDDLKFEADELYGETIGVQSSGYRLSAYERLGIETDPSAASTAASDIEDELAAARAQRGPMASAHEGWAVLYEEVEELKREVFWGMPDAMRQEAVQVGAMARRFIEDVCDRDDG